MSSDLSLSYASLKNDHERTLTSLSTLKEVVHVLKQELQDTEKLKEEACECVDSLQTEVNELRPIKRQFLELSDSYSWSQEEVSRLRNHIRLLSDHEKDLKRFLKDQKLARMYESQRAEQALMHSHDLLHRLSSVHSTSSNTPSIEDHKRLISKITLLESQLREKSNERTHSLTNKPSVGRETKLTDGHRLLPNSPASPLPSSSFVSLSKENSTLKAVVERQSEELNKLRLSGSNRRRRNDDTVDLDRLEQLLIVKDREVVELTNQLLMTS
ncbi:hypothetical protein GEMRC1_004575 [Eukaryota sp. GEM-RC1]